jgi:DNA gyrase inhibitor GyrI
MLALVGAFISSSLGLLSLPPSGQLVALPYFFFGLAIALAVVGGVCILAARGYEKAPRSRGEVAPGGATSRKPASGATETPADESTAAADVEVRIVRLEPMRVACAQVLSENPERDAWERLRVWAEPRGLLDDASRHPVFGFNNPAPSPDREGYGYEFWIRVDDDVESEGEVEVKDFAGGLYAVTRCKLYDDPGGSVLEVWQRLFAWVKESRYQWRQTHELEKPLDPRAPEQDLVLDLYLPIEE